jgi:hypothetical protein
VQRDGEGLCGSGAGERSIAVADQPSDAVAQSRPQPSICSQRPFIPRIPPVRFHKNRHPGLIRQHAKDSGSRDRRRLPLGIFFSLSLEHGGFFIRIADH